MLRPTGERGRDAGDLGRAPPGIAEGWAVPPTYRTKEHEMGILTEQMRNLAADITSSRDERRAWLGALREDVGAMRAEMHSEGRGRRGWVKSLHGEIGRMRHELRRDLAGARRAWQEATIARPRTTFEHPAAKRPKPAARHRK